MNTDGTTIRIVVLFVGLVALVLVGGIVVLAAMEKPSPTALETLAGTAVGGLIALLVSTRSSGSNDAPAPVTVTNPPEDPVQVETAL